MGVYYTPYWKLGAQWWSTNGPPPPSSEDKKMSTIYFATTHKAQIIKWVFESR